MVRLEFDCKTKRIVPLKHSLKLYKKPYTFFEKTFSKSKDSSIGILKHDILFSDRISKLGSYRRKFQHFESFFKKVYGFLYDYNTAFEWTPYSAHYTETQSKPTMFGYL